MSATSCSRNADTCLVLPLESAESESQANTSNQKYKIKRGLTELYRESRQPYNNVLLSFITHAIHIDKDILCFWSIFSDFLGTSRGFAFVEFNTQEEATRWMELKQVSHRTTCISIYIYIYE